ncbi:MAG TPA: DUF1127 domain-containing protein [Pseudolabrys sp.]|nr:DUF1127 domain-containing protein [Pseudolabrys sp.]
MRPRSLPSGRGMGAQARRTGFCARSAQLDGLTDVELKDIGLSRHQIDAVANGKFSR